MTSSTANLKAKTKRQFKSKTSRNKQNKKKFNQEPLDTASENEGKIQTEQKESQFPFDISNLVATNQQEINSGPFPPYEPPPEWNKIESNDFTTFDFKNVHKEENELWLFKIPPTVSKSDLQGLTLKLPIGLSRVPTKVAAIQKALQEHLNKKTKSDFVEYHVYEMPNDDISQENEMAKEFVQELRAPHEIIFRRMKELEIFLPCQEAQGLLLSHKRPTRYFNICRPVNKSDPSSNIDSILAKKPERIPHPPETFVPRYTASFPDYSKKHMIEARTAEKKFMNKMMNEWNFPKWQQQIKSHEEIVESVYEEHQKKCIVIVSKSKKKFAKELEEKRRQKDVEEEKTKRKKRKSSSGSTDDISTSSSSEKNPLKKIKTLADLRRRNKFRCKKIEELDTDSEILKEVAEEEVAFIKLAKNQIYQRKQAAKEIQEAEKRADDTWTPALVNYPIYKPPDTLWSKTYNKILNETEQTKLRPKLAKRKYTLEERLDYYKKHGREPPLYVVPRTRGKRIEINYVGINGNFEILEPKQKRILPPPPPGTTGHLQPCVELIDS